MYNKMSKKFISTLLLMMFVGTNSLLTASSMENAAENAAPVLRDGNKEFTMRLKGDVSYIKSKEPITLSLRDSDVQQVLRMFADKAGMNIVFHDSAKGNVTLDLVDVPLSTAFDMIMGITNLNYVVESNTIFVAKSDAKDFNMAKQDMTIIPVKYISASALAEFLNKNIFGAKKPGLSGTEIVTTNPSTNELIIFGSTNDVTVARKVVEKFDKKPITTTFKVNHTTPAEMADMVCKMLLPATGTAGGGKSTGKAANITSNIDGVLTGAASSSSSGGSSSSSSGSSSSGSSGGGSGSSMKLNEGKVACTLDSKLSGEVSSLGLQNLSVAYYSQLGTVSVLGGSENQLEMIKDFIISMDKKQPQAYLEVSIIELNENGQKELTNSWTLFSKFFSASFDGQLGTNPLYPTFFAGDGYDIVDISSGTPEVKYSVQKYSGPFMLSYMINYLVKNGKARVVVNPRIVVTNGVESKIDVTQDYLASVEIDSSTSTGGTVVTRDYNISNDQGVQVSITPFISPDGYVTLNIKPQYSTEIGTVNGMESINGRNIEYTAATLLSHRNLDLKNIRIKDGETLVIAGMIQENETKTVSKVPVLGDVPVIGGMFRNTVSQKVKTEMMILLTPKIITDNEDAVQSTDTL